MDNLIKPEFGLMFWTLATFSLLVVILGKFAWKPILKALEDRENRLENERKSAEEARESAERLQSSLDGKLAEISKSSRQAIQDAMDKGKKERDKIIEEAKAQAQKLMDKSKKDLQLEKERLVKELRGEISGLSIMAAKKIVGEELKTKNADKMVSQLIRDLEDSK
jgi:F-type H+-transporting ATPase subunit b